MIRVFLPSQLDSYTGGLREVDVPVDKEGSEPVSLRDVIAALEQRFRGLSFRIIDEQGEIRRHIAIFVGEQMVRTLDVPLERDARIQIVGALSGG